VQRPLRPAIAREGAKLRSADAERMQAEPAPEQTPPPASCPKRPTRRKADLAPGPRTLLLKAKATPQQARRMKKPPH